MRHVLWLLCACFLVAGSVARAELRALLVGVSDYDNAIGLADLRGPVNDITLMQRVLTERGADQITVLADGIDGAQRPTRTAVLDGFAALAASAGPGDLVYIHLSGHGTRQPDQNGDETDGLDEVFLPADTMRAEPGSNAIPNALTDDEIGAALLAIRRTGADVWFVMDACHSGSGTRAAAVGTAARYIDPAVLGVTARESALAEPQAEAQGPEPAGRLLAFYAAQSTEVAREVAYDEGDGAEAWYGLFTSKLAARLEAAQGLSYRQLFQAVLADMNDSTLPGGARLQTPLWEGDFVDAQVFGGADTTGLRRFAIRNGQLDAGKVHGLAEGTIVGLVDDAAAPVDALIGLAQLRKAKATSSTLALVAPDCVPRAAELCPDMGRVPPEARFAQVVARPVDLVVRLSPPVDFATGAVLADGDPALAALTAALAAVNADDGTRMTIDPAQFDIDVIWAQGALWFGPRASIGASPVGLSVGPEAEALADALRRIRKAEELARLLNSVTTKPSILSPSPVDVAVQLTNVPVDRLEPPGSGVAPFDECMAAYDAAPTEPSDLPPAAELKQCDQLSFTATGKVAGARDVNRVHIDAKFCVHADHERVEGTAFPRRIGDGMILCSDCPDGYSAGAERLFVVVTEAADNAEPLNLEGLVETCADQTGTRGSAGGDAAQVIDFLSGLAQRPGTRGSFGAMSVADVWVQRYDWQVLPKPEAFARAGRLSK